MTKLREIMTRDLATVDSNASVRDAARLMADRDVGDVLVIDGDRLAGIITDRDIVVKALARGSGDAASVMDCMTPDVLTCSPDASVEEAARVMADNKVRRMPVVEDGRPVGIVSLGDLATRAGGRQDERAFQEVSTPGGPNEQ